MKIEFESEREFELHVIRKARRLGWHCEKRNPSTFYNDRGIADLRMRRDGNEIQIELKMPGGWLSHDQQENFMLGRRFGTHMWVLLPENLPLLLRLLDMPSEGAEAYLRSDTYELIPLDQPARRFRPPAAPDKEKQQ